MATSAREGGSGSRERDNRKGLNSSSNPIAKKQPALSSSPSTNKHSSSLEQRKPFSTSTSKPAPNYQKPTISSRLDPSATKTVPRRPTAATKPSERRQSLDSHAKLPRSSSSLSSSAPSRTINAGTSSSSSIKTRVPQRSVSSLSSRSGKQPAVAPSIRRSLSTTRAPPNAGLRRTVKKTGSKSVVSDSTLEMEARDKDPLDEMIGSQEDQDEVLSLPEISEMPGQEEPLGDPIIIELPHLALQDEHKVEEEQSVEDDGEREVIIEASSSGENEESSVIESEEETNNVEEKRMVAELEESTEVEEEVEDAQVEVKKEEEIEVKKEEEIEVKKEESLAKHEIITQSGNKKEVHDYNGVIEETASKLMEKRNKVRALAGAFETVISLQDHK